MERRRFVQSLVALSAVGGLGLIGGAPRGDAATFVQLGAPDANGLRLRPGFSSRIIATTGQPVAGTGFVWHADPDGGATFPVAGGGWIYVSNSETNSGGGGVSAVEFDSTGAVVDARTILSGTTRNCAGGPMPWGTWLSCEEIQFGLVWECDPTGVLPAIARPGMGQFNHEAAAADPVAQVVYLTEDKPDGGLYRFTPTVWGDLSTGLLEVMTESAGVLGFAPVPDPTGQAGPVPTQTRYQVANMKIFEGGEGAWFADGILYFATKRDNRVWTYTPSTNSLVTIYDGSAPGSILTGVDNLAAGPDGDVYVCEDGGNMEVVELSADGSVSPFLQITGAPSSEVTGVAFDPSGDRMYVSSQRNPGVTYEITGPFVVVPMCDGQPVDVDIGAGESPTSGDDVILGTSGAETIDGGDGDDIICGLGGDDVITGGDGDDVILAGNGNDTVSGGDGKDRIRGQNGNDTINGGAGNDNLNGNNGNDTVNGGDGHDFVSGRDGRDTVTGGPGTDTVLGGGKTDLVKGGPGNDVMFGNAFADEMYGGTGNDWMDGGDGGDHLRGETGNDTLLGGRGNDVLDGASGTDECDGKSGIDSEEDCEIIDNIP